MTWVDLHCHILPGVDDGAPDLETSMDLGAGLYRLGFDTIVGTPHVGQGSWDGAPEEIHALARLVEESLLDRLRPPGNGGEVSLRVLPGGEHFLDAPFLRRLEEGKALAYPRNRGILLELSLLPGATFPGLREVMFRVRVKGFQPILAHPERYDQSHRSIDWLEQLRGEGVAMLGDMLSLTGKSGRASRKALEKMMDRGLIDGMCTDVHSPEDIPALEESLGILEKAVGRSGVDSLLGWGRNYTG